MKHTKKQILEGIESKQSRIVAPNTVEYWQGEKKKIRLHFTDIITYNPNGSFELNSGGWRTVTTKDRLNKFAPVNVYQTNGVWFVNDTYVFYDGITFDRDNNIISKAIKDPTKENKKIKKQIKAFVAQVDKGIPQPNAGDCWGCLMVTREGERPIGNNCVKDHLKENYLHGSLIVRALQANGYQRSQLPYVLNNEWTVKNALRRFMTKQCIEDIAV